MPEVIANRHTLEAVPATPENRIKLYREEFNSNYREYTEKYEHVRYGGVYGNATVDTLEKYGLVAEHTRLLQKRKDHAKVEADKVRASLVQNLSDSTREEVQAQLLELYDKLDASSQADALGIIEGYEEDAQYCSIYR